MRSHAGRELRLLALLAACLPTGGAIAGVEARDAVFEAEFLFEQARFASCHASTIAETPRGLVAAWFGGSAEGHPDVGIWVARRREGRWSEPAEIADGRQEGGGRHPCWNPVLFQAKDGPLLLFYKVGPSPSRWWGMIMTSDDCGTTWSRSRRLPEGVLGPIKNKPVRLADNALLCPSSTEHDGWRVHLERTPDLGKSWTTIGLPGQGPKFAVIQPTILSHPRGALQILCRSRQGRIVESWSHDGGATWEPLSPTDLPNPDSGIDAVSLADGRHLLVYNHARAGRTPLSVAISEDGRTWKAGPVLEAGPGEYSYPAVIEAADGRVHITYTWKRRRIKHVVLDPVKLTLRNIPADSGPRGAECSDACSSSSRWLAAGANTRIETGSGHGPPVCASAYCPDPREPRAPPRRNRLATPDQG